MLGYCVICNLKGSQQESTLGKCVPFRVTIRQELLLFLQTTTCSVKDFLVKPAQLGSC